MLTSYRGLSKPCWPPHEAKRLLRPLLVWRILVILALSLAAVAVACRRSCHTSAACCCTSLVAVVVAAVVRCLLDQAWDESPLRSHSCCQTRPVPASPATNLAPPNLPPGKHRACPQPTLYPPLISALFRSIAHIPHARLSLPPTKTTTAASIATTTPSHTPPTQTSTPSPLLPSSPPANHSPIQTAGRPREAASFTSVRGRESLPSRCPQRNPSPADNKITPPPTVATILQPISLEVCLCLCHFLHTLLRGAPFSTLFTDSSVLLFCYLLIANIPLLSASSSTGSLYGQDDLQRPNVPFSSQSQISLSSAGDTDSGPTAGGKPRKSKPFGLLGRSKSNRDKDRPNPKPAPVTLPNTPGIPIAYDSSAPLRTAPVAQDRAFREMMNSTIRNRSEDRAPARNGSASRENLRDRDRDHNHKMHSSSYKENGGSTFLSGLRGSRAADIFSKGLFGKSTRSGSTTEREPVVDDEHYVLKVINLPLIEQTRLTRISKRLEHSRDKTEFWMPAFPWRAIDYLNYKGCDVEGLYRVPGSGPQIKKWQRRFDERMLNPPTSLGMLALTDSSPQNMMSISSTLTIYTISILLAPC